MHGILPSRFRSDTNSNAEFWLFRRLVGKLHTEYREPLQREYEYQPDGWGYFQLKARAVASVFVSGVDLNHRPFGYECRQILLTR
jgi:hypothetical protein